MNIYRKIYYSSVIPLDLMKNFASMLCEMGYSGVLVRDGYIVVRCTSSQRSDIEFIIFSVENACRRSRYYGPNL